jgi:hypothetical protein
VSYIRGHTNTHKKYAQKTRQRELAGFDRVNNQKKQSGELVLQFDA